MSAAADQLRKDDPDRYFATLVLPEAVRAKAQALFAFSSEIAGIAARVSEPNAGEIRLRWWIDAIEGQGHGAVARHALAAELLAAGFSAPPLLRLIRARRFDLYADPMPDVATFEGYAGESVSVLYQLVAVLLNGGEEPANGDAAGHLGVAQALIGHLRAFGYHSSRGRIFLPWSIFAANGVLEEEVLGGTVGEGLLAALQQMRELATDHLRKARDAIAATDKHLRPAFATIALLPWELRAAESIADTPFAVPRPRADWQKIAALSWWTWRNA
jgi:phytoene synthase